MKVYLPAIMGHVPTGMIRAISAFMELCYLVRQSQLDSVTLEQIDAAVTRFHQERQIFIDTSLGDVQLARYRAWHYPGSLDQLSSYVGQPRLIEYIRRFLYDQFNPDADICGMDVQIDACPYIHTGITVKVYHFALSTYHAPSDLSCTGGMLRERIRAVPSWKEGPGRFDCVLGKTRMRRDLRVYTSHASSYSSRFTSGRLCIPVPW